MLLVRYTFALIIFFGPMGNGNVTKVKLTSSNLLPNIVRVTVSFPSGIKLRRLMKECVAKVALDAVSSIILASCPLTRTIPDGSSVTCSEIAVVIAVKIVEDPPSAGASSQSVLSVFSLFCTSSKPPSEAL